MSLFTRTLQEEQHGSTDLLMTVAMSKWWHEDLILSVSGTLQVFSYCLRASGRTGIIASEEEDTPVAVEETYSGNYVVVFDPLDGSSNIDAAVSTGSIFGIYRSEEGCFTDLGDNPTVCPLHTLKVSQNDSLPQCCQVLDWEIVQQFSMYYT